MLTIFVQFHRLRYQGRVTGCFRRFFVWRELRREVRDQECYDGGCRSGWRVGFERTGDVAFDSALARPRELSQQPTKLSATPYLQRWPRKSLRLTSHVAGTWMSTEGDLSLRWYIFAVLPLSRNICFGPVQRPRVETRIPFEPWSVRRHVGNPTICGPEPRWPRERTVEHRHSGVCFWGASVWCCAWAILGFLFFEVLVLPLVLILRTG